MNRSLRFLHGRAAAAALVFALGAGAGAESPETAHAHDHGEPVPVQARRIDASVDLLVAGGASTEDNAGLEALQGGGHDPRREGFTLQQAELSLAGTQTRTWTANCI